MHARVEIWLKDEGLHVVEGGTGAPVVFLHGGLADHRAAWLRVGALAERHRLITPDVRGSGRSHHAGPLSWARLGDDVAGVLDRLAIERAVVGGTSAGSGVALAFALRHPARLRGLMLFDSVFGGGGQKTAPASREAMARMDAVAQRALVEGHGPLLALFDALPPPIRERARAMAATFDLPSVAASTRLYASGEQPFASVDELASIEAPVLLVPGVDPQHPREIAERYRAHLRAAHWLEPDAPDFAAQLAAFVDRCP